MKDSNATQSSSNPAQSSSKTAQSKKGLLNAAANTGRSVAQTGKTIVTKVGQFGGALTQQTVRWLEQSAQGAGHAVQFLGDLPFARKFAGALKLDWLLGLSDQVDLDKATAAVKQIQEKYPNESPQQIAHRIMVQKALQAGGIGLASSLLPGFATALLAVDLAATTALQTEMVYQIAAAYNLDLHDPARRGEVLGIFGLALGGRNAVKAGLSFLRNVPVAGAMIGGGTNATMLYSLGYAARQFYEAKAKATTPQPTEDTLKSIQQESEKYLTVAMAQQAVLDQIVVHMILASYPEKSWEDILPELRTLQIEEASLSVIAEHLKSPQPLGALLQQLNCDFAVPLLAQCRRIAEQHEEISTAEQEVLDAIAEKCNVQAILPTAAT